MTAWKELGLRWADRVRRTCAGREGASPAADNSDTPTVSQFLVQRQGRRRADALAERILDALRAAPGTGIHDLATRLHETQIMVVNEVDRLAREGRVRFDREAGAVFPTESDPLPAATTFPPASHSPSGRIMLVLLLVRLYRGFREVPGARIEATSRSIQLYVRDHRLLEAVIPADDDYLWLELPPSQTNPCPRRERIRTLHELLARLDALRPY